MNITTHTQESIGATHPAHTPAYSHQKVYQPGGFWLRFLAMIIDGFITAGLGALVNIPFILIIVAISNEYPNLAKTLYILNILVSLAIGMYYFGFFLSRYGATPGKKLFKLRVIHNKTGAHLSFVRALLREYVGKILAILPFGIGYLIAPFQANKRGLHDFIASSRVVREK